MPIYAYTCTSCKQSRDVLQKIGAPAPDCLACQKPLARHLTSPGGFQLNGGGYYKPGFNK